MTASVDHVKVRCEHQERLAFVYVRQSSPRQVRNNLESQRLQYGFAEQAVALGWTHERIIVLDEDQGQSAALPNARSGFGDMVAAVARGAALLDGDAAVEQRGGGGGDARPPGDRGGGIGERGRISGHDGGVRPVRGGIGDRRLHRLHLRTLR